MTEDIGSDKHKRQPSQEIEVAVIKERLREAGKRDELILSTLTAIKEEQAKQGTMLALGNQRFDAIEELQEDTSTRIVALDARVVAVETDKRGPIALIFSTLAAIAGGIGAYFGFNK